MIKTHSIHKLSDIFWIDTSISNYSSWTIQAAMAMRQYVHTLPSRGWVTHSMSFWLACFHICCESFFDKLFMKYSARRNGNAVKLVLAYAYTPAALYNLLTRRRASRRSCCAWATMVTRNSSLVASVVMWRITPPLSLETTTREQSPKPLSYKSV